MILNKLRVLTSRSCNTHSNFLRCSRHRTILLNTCNSITTATLPEIQPQNDTHFDSNFSESDLFQPIINYNENPLQLDKKALSMYHTENSSFPRALSFLHASIQIGDMERARRFFQAIYSRFPEIAKESIDIYVHNTFLNGYIENQDIPNMKKASEWFNSMKSLYNTQPDIDTYAILIKGYLKLNRPNVTTLFIKQMQKSNFSIDDLKMSTHLKDDDFDRLYSLLQSSQPAPALDSQVLSDQLFGSGPGQTKESSELSTDTSSIPTPFTPKPYLMSTNTIGVKILEPSFDLVRDGRTSLNDRQIKLEELALTNTIELMKHHLKGRNDPLLTQNFAKLDKTMKEWSDLIARKVAEEQRVIRASRENPQDQEEGDAALPSAVYKSFFLLLPPEKMAQIAIQGLFRCHKNYETFTGSPLSHILTAVGTALEKEYHSDQMKKRTNRYLVGYQSSLQQLFSSGRLFEAKLRQIHSEIQRKRINSNWVPKWPLGAQVQVASALISLIIDNCKFEHPETKIITPAFNHSYAMVEGANFGVVKFHPFISESLTEHPMPNVFHARFLPMLTMPLPWLTYNAGGLLTARLKCMRGRDNFEQVLYLKKADQLGRLTSVLCSLDVLGSTKWRISHPILDTLTKVWNTGKEFTDIPPSETNIFYPPKPEFFEEDAAVRRQWKRECTKIDNKVKDNHSLRCDVNYKVEIASSFKDHEFYFPHNLDFRGRAYPIPPLFNHLGNDLCRGLLVFAAKKPLGKNGLNWLKIHLASVSGYDKYSFEDRIKYTEEHLGDIFDSADKPLEGRMWWSKTEKPWQVLSACCELTAALRSADPEKFESCLPIHQDGTCNGLQHYAALGGDVDGARQVNLIPSEKPQDVYSGVLKLVLEKIEADKAKNVEQAVLLHGHVTRKVIKQTVMTNVYGVTFVGAKEQILGQLKDIPSLKDQEINPLAMYLTHQVFSSLGEIFTSAQALQGWLNECAGRIASSIPGEMLLEAKKPKVKRGKKSTKSKQVEEADMFKLIEDPNELAPAEDTPEEKEFTLVSYDEIKNRQMTSVIWTTPLGLTIVQPYRKQMVSPFKTNLQHVQIFKNDVITPVNSRKQRTAFPPNFIHSLDATHMMMTALQMQKAGCDFASVHDSYWTHASDMETMNKSLREQFVKLHSDDIMGKLRQEFLVRYKGYKVRAKTNSAKNKPNLLKDLLDDHKGEEVDDVEVKTPLKGGWVDLEIPPLPKRGEFDVKSVLGSPYFFH